MLRCTAAVSSSLPPILSNAAKKAQQQGAALKTSQTNPSKKKRKTSIGFGAGAGDRSSRRVGQMTEQVMKAYGVPKGYAGAARAADGQQPRSYGLK